MVTKCNWLQSRQWLKSIIYYKVDSDYKKVIDYKVDNGYKV